MQPLPIHNSIHPEDDGVLFEIYYPYKYFPLVPMVVECFSIRAKTFLIMLDTRSEDRDYQQI
jgi:hypothetical protein